MNSKKKNDIILIIVVLIAAALFLVFRGGAAKRDSAVIVVTAGEKEIFREKSSDLQLPYTLNLEAQDGGHNVVVIDENEDGTIGIQCMEADCPDKICVQTGHITMPDQPIVCLPHRISVIILKK